MPSFTIPGRLPGMNDILDAAKRHWSAYAAMKSDNTQAVGWIAKRLPHYEAVEVIITWYEPDERRDYDNITAATKFILDGLVQAGALKNDTRKQVRRISHVVKVDRANPRVEVQIKEV